jgi:hypothetical protein
MKAQHLEDKDVVSITSSVKAEAEIAVEVGDNVRRPAPASRMSSLVSEPKVIMTMKQVLPVNVSDGGIQNMTSDGIGA